MATSSIKLSAFVNPEPSEDELLFARQLGLDHVYTWVSDHKRDYESLLNLRRVSVTRRGQE